MHYGQGKNQPTIGSTYSDAKPTYSSHGRKGPSIFLGYGTDGEFGCRLWDRENQKLIWSSDVVFNKDSILPRNHQKVVGKKLSFEIDIDVVEGPTHRSELAL